MYCYLIDAKKASRIVNELGMRSKLDMRLCAHKFEFDRQRDKLEKEMERKYQIHLIFENIKHSHPEL